MASPNINVLLKLQDKFTPKLKEISQSTGIATGKLKQANKAIGNIASNIGKVALGIGTAMAGAVAGITGFAISVGADFEASMSKVSAISGASGKALEELTDKAKELGAKTSLSASEVAEAMQYMAMAGWDSTAIKNGVEDLVHLAEASGEQLGTVSDIVTDAMTAFGMSSKEVGRFGDVLSATASNANTNVAMMGESFKECSALAGTMGYTIEDMALAIGVMANAGIKGGSAGTALKNAISNMAKPTKQMEEVMTQLGLSLTDTEGNMKDFKTIMLELRSSFKSLTKEEQASASATLFGKESMAGMLSIISASDEDFNKLSNAINTSRGATAKMAQTMNNNFNGAVKSFKSKVEAVGIAIYDKFKTPITEALNGVNDTFGAFVENIATGELSGSFEKLGDSIGKMVKGIADTLPVILPVLASMFSFIIDNGDIIISVLSGIVAGFVAFNVITTVMSMISAFSVALEGVTGAMAMFNAVIAMNPIGMAVIAIGALVGALVFLWTHWDTVTEYAGKFWDKLKEVHSWLAGAFMNIITAVGEKLGWVGDIIGSVIGGIGRVIDKAKTAVGFGESAGGNTPHNATGTSYFKGGQTYVNENNRGELINLPNGSQIVPHDLAKSTMNSSQNININLTVQGNVIGNEDFYNECGRAITAKLGVALANM